NLDIPKNASTPEAIGALKASASIDPDRGIIITGYGKTYIGQKDAHYEFIAKPDRAHNLMNFEVKYFTDPVGTGPYHTFDLGGFTFGEG
ncbi:hypothetical protein NL501_28860, partial [Klebsiella pneumoniae]|nr:hypothetical protein [Klebsiella pneumoniae]